MATRRVLLIEDEPDVQAVVRECLEEIAGWEVLTADSGREGLVQVLAHQPDAILLDWMMPQMSGHSFLQALRTYVDASKPLTVFKDGVVTRSGSLPSDEGRPQPIPVVLLTAKSDFSKTDQLSELGVKGIITKPFDPIRVSRSRFPFGWLVNSRFDRVSVGRQPRTADSRSSCQSGVCIMHDPG